VATLDELRAEIDRIDGEILELLIRRIRLAGDIARRKAEHGDGPVVRPAREAAILRRLVELAAGRFPADALVRIWRELFAATGRAQRPYAVAVHARSCAEREVVRDHLGSVVPLLRADSCAHALRLVRDGRAELAVLPLDEATAGWWWRFAEAGGDGLGAAARLPFLVRGDDLPPLFLVGRVPLEPSGRDRTLLALLTEHGLSRSRLAEVLARAGDVPALLAATETPEGTVHFVEVEGFHSAADPRLGPLLAPLADRLLRRVVLGAYPRPMAPPAPSTRTP